MLTPPNSQVLPNFQPDEFNILVPEGQDYTQNGGKNLLHKNKRLKSHVALDHLVYPWVPIT